MNLKITKLFLLLSLLMPLRIAIANSTPNEIDINALNKELNYELVSLSQEACENIIRLRNLLPNREWSETFRNLCLDIKDSGNVALYEQVNQVVTECLDACKDMSVDQMRTIQTSLENYRTTLYSGGAHLDSSEMSETEMNNEPEESMTRSNCCKTKKPKKFGNFCRICVRCLTVNGTLSVNGRLLVNGVDFTTLTGIAGAIGAAGASGAQGVPGIPGVGGILGYGYIYNLTAQAVAIEASVPFSNNGPLSGITHAVSSPSIGIVSAGTYAVIFSVSGTEPNQFAIFVNGIANTSTVYGSGAGTQQNTGIAIMTLGAGDVVTLVNHSSAAAVGLASVVGGTQANVNASVLLLRLT